MRQSHISPLSCSPSHSASSLLSKLALTDSEAALAGSFLSLSLAPALFRDKLKARPAVILAFFLAIDPALVALSRQAGSTIIYSVP